MSVDIKFKWTCHPDAEAVLLAIQDSICNHNTFVTSFSKALLKNTSTRLFDWVDHYTVSYSATLESDLKAVGFVVYIENPRYNVYYHPAAQLPKIVMLHANEPYLEIAVSVDSISDFLMVQGMSRDIEGSLFSGYRRCYISTEDHTSMSVVERRGTMTMEPTITENFYLENYFYAKEQWKSRLRDSADEDEILIQAILKAEEIVALVGVDLAACIILECEREYWQTRNSAGQIQKNRQDRLGMGWANHDHHTFRSSRRHFSYLIRLFEMLGFSCRERFYAGKEAGWGAQVMENPRCRLVLFLDVDLTPQELNIDLAHERLAELEQLGTIGLWCALHGDSILGAGMHHLEAQFMFDELAEDLKDQGVEMMKPFSFFPHLKQAFTKGERWSVKPEKIQTLLEENKISSIQAKMFLEEGAVGSHLENLQRREGFKGFNQENVSAIIKETDPRLMSEISRNGSLK